MKIYKYYSTIIFSVLLYKESICQYYPDWTFKNSGYFGYSVGKKNDLKRIMLITGINNSFEKNIKATLFFTFGLDVMSLKFNYITSTGNSAFSNNYFISIPVTVKKYYKVGNKSDIFLNFGIAPAYYISSKENIESGNSTNNKSLGVNIGGVAGFGFKTQISKKLFFDISLNAFQDFIYAYSDNADRLTIKSNSIMYSFYWVIK